MDGGEGRKAKGSLAQKPSKFSVYRNPSLSAALTANSLRPSKYTFLFIVSLSTASVLALFGSLSRENGMIDCLKVKYVSEEVVYIFAKVIQTTLVCILLGNLLALIKVISMWKSWNTINSTILSPPKGAEQTVLTNRQLGLLGLKQMVEQIPSESSKKPPKSKINSVSPSNVLVPLHHPQTTPKGSSRISGDRSNTSSGNKMHLSKSPVSPSLYLVSGGTSQSSSVQASPSLDQFVSSPWSRKRPSSRKEITTEESLEQFLADVDEKISESAHKLATPPPTLSGIGMSTPNNIGSPANTSGTTRSTPLRSVRMSPGSQKFSTPPKKGEGDLPRPMSMEESIEAFERLGIYPHIEEWRDRLRQWFSSILLNPLLNKIETSHVKVMQVVAKLGISIKINKLGSDLPSTESTTNVSPIERTSEWQPAYTLDEEGLLHQLRANLVQALDSSMPKLPLGNLQLSPQQSVLIRILQECIDAITEHQRLHALMKGEWVKGLLPQSSVQADYAVQRIQELAEGTCVKNYEYLGNGEVYDKVNKKWTLELPTDSHLLLYLFCAFLEHPKWMLHVDPISHTGSQSSKNPLFLGVLPPKERFPEKYVAAVFGIPAVLHPGACILAVGKQSPPIFALYWDKKAQFSLQGRTAFWDSILLLCHKIKVSYGGIVRGMHLGSSAFGILPVLDPDTED